MSEFIGRFHPLVVHLPIGILLIALLLHALSRKEKYKPLHHAVPLLILFGAFTALFSCITGYLLSGNDDYDETLVSQHMWMGIAVTSVSFFLYFQFTSKPFSLYKNITAIVLLIGISITGHLGGSLTHGSDYLSAPLKNIFSSSKEVEYKILPLKNAQEAKVYSDVVKPILQTRCYSCHNENKQKGSLRMDDSLLLMKGGKHGVIIDLKDLSSSELLERIQLPADNEKHMPPKQKLQLTESQVALLHWWISNGASFTHKVKELPQDDKTKKMLTALQHASDENLATLFTNLPPVEKGDAKAIDALKSKGVIVEQATLNSNYIKISFVTVPNIDADELAALVTLQKQVISVNLRNTNAGDETMQSISKLESLIRLDLSNTKITDAGLTLLQPLHQLKSLSIVGNSVGEKGLAALKDIKTLSNVYAFKTGINASCYAQLKSIFPKTKIDTGGYVVATLPGDTTMLKTEY